MKISENTVLITGGGSGIGLAIAEALLAANNNVIICGRNWDKLKKAKERYTKLELESLDLTDDSSMRSLVNIVQDKYPNLNILVNNAGVYKVYKTENTETLLASIDREIATNFSGPIKLTSLLLPLLKSQKNAAVINVSSILAYIPFVHTPIYSASKAAMHFHSLSLRHQLKETGVQVFEVLPPLVDTEMVAAVSGPKLGGKKFRRKRGTKKKFRRKRGTEKKFRRKRGTEFDI
jgi:uncharacterized oxidoreductase